MNILLLIVGVVLLVWGAEWLVRGAARLALRLGLTPLVIGLTVVAFGTSSPEVAVSVSSTLKGANDLAIGNVVGSNIFNVLFILGVSALILPLVVARQFVRNEVPILIGVSLLLLLMCLDQTISRWDGALLLLGGIGYTWLAIWLSRREVRRGQLTPADLDPHARPEAPGRLWVNLALIVAGLVLLVLGSRLVVLGAVGIARALGISDVIIGLTIVAAGTSLPEVAPSDMAALRGQRDIAVGNVIGSNIMNILIILGICGVVTPGQLTIAPSLLAFDLPVMVAVALACLPIFMTGHVIARWEGALFFLYYVFYVCCLVMGALGHTGFTTTNAALLWFVLPIATLTLVVGLLRWLRSRSGQSQISNQPGDVA